MDSIFKSKKDLIKHVLDDWIGDYGLRRFLRSVKDEMLDEIDFTTSEKIIPNEYKYSVHIDIRREDISLYVNGKMKDIYTGDIIEELRNALSREKIAININLLTTNTNVENYVLNTRINLDLTKEIFIDAIIGFVTYEYRVKIIKDKIDKSLDNNDFESVKKYNEMLQDISYDKYENSNTRLIK